MKYSPVKIRRAFSLIEVLLAVFILGIGLIMVASIFPVGADWTRQSTENSVGQNIALDALAIIQSHYPQGSLNATSSFAAPMTNVQALPNLATKIPFTERAYLFGNTKPFPVPNPTASLYYWTALARVNPGDCDTAGNPIPSASHRYDIYILVFRKGTAEQVFGKATAYSTEITGCRDIPTTGPISLSTIIPNGQITPPATPPTYDYFLEPAVIADFYNPGTFTNSLTGEIPPVSTYGIGQKSGTVFRQFVSSTGTAVARPQLTDTEIAGTTDKIIYAPPADGTALSPLIYVYQTTICQ